ncbi:MAG: rRNA (adenine2503-C2)-methyltransferase [Bacillota bacterium]|jgi:23S rRNA (adenine2503-C2)-methyltransferase|nr:rRNA (adenine2503-C2)-methyltransferase [Bacillota bacterium]MDK2882009.1 rRNA (adenine2503-C2)-methyltransferase [Bacillota bacterium]MDK2960034.1 rRNA (adenine2503-C2)-methyltransferase [Bacillota bacterium]
MEKIKLKGLSFTELAELIATWGEARYRADQIYTWVFRHLVRSYAEMTNLPVWLRARLEEDTVLETTTVARREFSPATGTVKLLFSLLDGQAVEGVLMRYRNWFSACISSQVGCRMGCRFCASTLGGLARNLEAAEMVDEVVALEREARGAGGRIRSVVLMGTGEPLDNYDNVLRFIHLIAQPQGLGIGYRRITLSTCGLVPGIRRLAREGLPITLSVSLHAPNDELRERLMPVNRSYPLTELLPACREYAEQTGRRVTFEYALIAGVNDSLEHARELVGLLQGFTAHVNLIPLNPVVERKLKRPNPRRVSAFAAVLKARGIPTTVRRELGTDISAACGQLRHQVLKDEGMLR